ncbi:MAG: nucleotidyl transferase AbiEii/AbiGii toxin family protein [Gemmataceae bacterium]|nr:nucleotidyl transferase AbiEii/AbiGii toxin family protein [Gemmataceae bacterium]
MNPAQADAWKSAVLDKVFDALAQSDELCAALVYKGARILKLRLGEGRQSLDIDSNLLRGFVERLPDRDEQRAFLEEEIGRAIRHHFERQEPVELQLKAVKVKRQPPTQHPMGWDAFAVRLNVNDLTRHVHGLPALDIDIAAPEELLAGSVSGIVVGGHEVRAYTLERIAGEKLRAFLSSLPAYRAKVRKPGEAVRAKDLYDVARILRTHGLGDEAFWEQAGQEFRLACRSRFIDCDGLITFREQWDVTRKTYAEATIPKDVPFDEAEAALAAVIGRFEGRGVVPFNFPLPERVGSG